MTTKINFAHFRNDSTDVLERETAFRWAGRLLGLTLTGHDLCEAPEVSRVLDASEPETETETETSPEWLHTVAAYGYLSVAIAYLVDIAVEYHFADLDHGQLSDHLAYLTRDSGLNLNESTYGLGLLSDEEWVADAYRQVLAEHWTAVESLVSAHWSKSTSDNVLSDVVRTVEPSRWALHSAS